MSKFDSYHYHEVTDRTCCFQEMWEIQVLNHDLVQYSAPLKEKAEHINALIAEFYQEVVNVEYGCKE